jgi:hypothetical protein
MILKAFFGSRILPREEQRYYLSVQPANVRIVFHVFPLHWNRLPGITTRHQTEDTCLWEEHAHGRVPAKQRFAAPPAHPPTRADRVSRLGTLACFLGYRYLANCNPSLLISRFTKHLISQFTFTSYWGKLINIDSIRNTLYEASQVPPFWWTGYCSSKCLCYRVHPFFNFYPELFLFSLVLISEWTS